MTKHWTFGEIGKEFRCITCGAIVLVKPCEDDHPDCDYTWYCSNPWCNKPERNP